MTLMKEVEQLRQFSATCLWAGMLREAAIGDSLAEFAELANDYGDDGWTDEEREAAHAYLDDITRWTGMSQPRIVDTCQRNERLVSIFGALVRTHPAEG